MKVNSANDNTNFRAMKINPVLRTEIAKMGESFVAKLNDYGNKIADVQMYDVVLLNDIKNPKIFSADKSVTRDFFYELRQEEKCLGKWYEGSAGEEGSTSGGFYPKEPKVFQKLFGKDAKYKYAEFKQKNVYEQAMEYSRMLEELDIKMMVAKAKEKSEKRLNEYLQHAKEQELNKALDNLIEKYGAEYHEEAVDKSTEHIKKAHWWQKLF